MLSRMVLAATLAITSVGFAGCGDGDGGDAVPKKFEEFLGIWQFDMSTAREECMGVPPENLTVTGINQHMRLGITSDLVAPGLFASTCNFKFAVDGKSANMLTDQTCDLGEGDFYKPTAGKFTLLSATTAEESADLTGKISFQTPQNTIVQIDCTLTIRGTLVKVAQD